MLQLTDSKELCKIVNGKCVENFRVERNLVLLKDHTQLMKERT